jgi:hypothetical protein
MRGIRWRQALVVGCCLWALAAPLQVAPRYLGYTNELFGQALVDSGLDWGQDLKGVATFQRQHPGSEMMLAYYGTSLPAAYGLRAQQVPLPGVGPWCDDRGPLNSEQPSREYLAASISALRLYQLRALWPLLQARPPAAVIGGSIWLWDVTRDAAMHQALGAYYEQVGFPAHARRQHRRAAALGEGD